jgi:hypothetical protein
MVVIHKETDIMPMKITATVAAALCAVISGAALSNNALARDVGDVEAVTHTAYGTPPSAAKSPKREGDPVAYRELLETQERSGLLLRLADGSKLTLGADSKLMVDDFVYQPQDGNGSGGASKALISIPAGALRYVTGAMPKGHTTIDTPTATMVLRGTNVTVGVNPQGFTHLFVDEGAVSVHSKVTDQDTVVKAGASVDITPDGIATSTAELTGDPLVDQGFTQKQPIYGNDMRRGERNQGLQGGGGTGSNRSSSSSSSDSGGDSGGDSSGGSGG